MKNIRRSLTGRIARSQTVWIGAVALLVGLTTGAGVWLFKWLVQLLTTFSFETLGSSLSPLGKWSMAIIPVVGGLIVGILTARFLGEEKLHGTAGVMQGVALAGGRLRYQKTPLKTGLAILSIGTGASVGPEDPSVQIGANLGSMLGQWLHLSDERTRMLVAAGAASAIAAAFNAPIAGVFFSLELILADIGGTTLGLILVAAVTSSLFTQAVSGISPAFPIPAYTFQSAWELPLYLALGLLAGPVSAGYIQLLYKIQDLYHRWKSAAWLRPVTAGLLLGGVGIFLPQVLGVGYSSIGEVLNKNDLTIWLLLALLTAKVILTPISIGSGFLGGVFAPALFIGAMLGGAFGNTASLIFPALHLTPAAFALVGMAAVLAGSVRAPLTAVILLFEMTNDYRIILPLMFAVAVSLLLSQRIQKDSVYAMGLARHGIRLDRGRDIEVMETVTVGEAMRPVGTPLTGTMSLDKAAEILTQSHHHGLPVVDKNGLLSGVLSVQDIEMSRGAKTVAQACSRNTEVAFPDETLNVAIRRMSRRDVGRLPVVSRDNHRKLIGILGRPDIIHAYDLALTRRTTQRHQEDAVHLDAMTPVRVDVTDIMVEKGSLCDGKRLKEIALPQDCVIASIRRGTRVFIPHGNTQMLEGDTLVVVAQGRAREEFHNMCKIPGERK